MEVLRKWSMGQLFQFEQLGLRQVLGQSWDSIVWDKSQTEFWIPFYLASVRVCIFQWAVTSQHPQVPRKYALFCFPKVLFSFVSSKISFKTELRLKINWYVKYLSYVYNAYKLPKHLSLKNYTKNVDCMMLLYKNALMSLSK